MPLHVPDTAESDISGGAIGRVRGSRSHAVAVAVGGVAKIGAAAHDSGMTGGRPGWIQAGGKRMVRGMEPIGTPFPRVAGDGKDAESIGWKGIDGRDTGEAIFGGIADWKFALPDITQM